MQNLQYIGKIMKPITRYLGHHYQQTIKQKAILLDPTYSIVLFGLSWKCQKEKIGMQGN